jgi:hypothetical protein
MRALVEFLKAALYPASQWVALMTGGLGVLALGIYERVAGTSVPLQTYGLIASVTLIVVLVMAWFREHRRVVELEASAAEDTARLAVRKALWEVPKEGGGIIKHGRKGVKDQEAADIWNQQQYEPWRRKVLERAEAYSPDLRHSLDRLDRIAPENQIPVTFRQGKHPNRVQTVKEICARIYRVLSPSA